MGAGQSKMVLEDSRQWEGLVSLGLQPPFLSLSTQKAQKMPFVEISPI